MPQILSTTLSPLHRTVSVLLSTGHSERYALSQTRDGDVFWRQDTFAVEAGTPGAWIGHGGRLTVAQVVACVPACAPQILAWTREELELGPDLPELDGFGRAVRADALRRLAGELAGAVPAAA